jgi:ketosteroid isomerase-like protein
MSLEENKALVRRYFMDAPYNPDICDEIFQPHFTFRSIQHISLNADSKSTPQEEKRACQWLCETWSDLKFTMDEMIAENDRIMVRWTFTGTQQGDYFGLPPTHKHVMYSGINIFHIVDGRIAEVSDIYDRLWLWQQLGVIPETKAFINKAKEKMK